MFNYAKRFRYSSKKEEVMRLKNQVAIITGSADPKGIGAAIAYRFAKEGAKLIIADIVDGTKVVNQVNKHGGEALYVQVDVTKQESCDVMAKATFDQFGSIDILINNAAIYADMIIKPFMELTTEEWDQVMKVNAGGPFHGIKAVFPYMKEKGGKIINTASDIFIIGDTGNPHYVASKGAVFALTRAMARELGEYNINVNSIAPGYTRSGASKRLEKHSTIPSEGWDDSASEIRCLKRTEYPEDMAGTAVFLACNDSDFITGQLIVVNGGAAFH